MKNREKDIFPLIGEYLMALALGLFLGTILDMVAQSLVWKLFSNVLICRIAESVLCLLVLSFSIGVTSSRMAYKQGRVDLTRTVLALTPVLVLQFILAFVFQFASYMTGAGFWLGVLFCHGNSGHQPFVETPSWYYLLGMAVSAIVYVATACLGQYIGKNMRMKSRKKLLNE